MHNIELFTFLLVGILITLAQVKIQNILKEMGKAQLWPAYTLVLVSNLLIALGVLWAVSSILEHEMQAAMSGILVFGGLGVVVGVLNYRLITKQ